MGAVMKKRVRRFVPLVVAVVVVGVVVLIARPWGGEEAVQEAAGSAVEHRLCDVVVTAPLASSATGQTERLVVSRSVVPWRELTGKLEARFQIQINGPIRSDVSVDPKTGTLLAEFYGTATQEARLQEILETLRVEPLDPATAPWPYTETSQAPEKRVDHGAFRYRRPDPGSGLVVALQRGQRLDRATLTTESVETLILANCSSEETRGIYLFTGEEDEPTSNIHPDDEAAFQTFFAEVEVWRLQKVAPPPPRRST